MTYINRLVDVAFEGQVAAAKTVHFHQGTVAEEKAGTSWDAEFSLCMQDSELLNEFSGA